MKKLLTTEDLAARWGISPRTLRNWRSLKRGPPYVKLGNANKSQVRYDLNDVVAYEKASQK